MSIMTDEEIKAKLRKALTLKICGFISPKSGMLDVEGLVDYLLEKVKEKNEANIS